MFASEYFNEYDEYAEIAVMQQKPDVFIRKFFRTVTYQTLTFFLEFIAILVKQVISKARGTAGN